MIWYRIVIGVFLVLCSSFLVEAFLEHYTVSMTISGEDYSSLIITKILDAIGGSLIIWGILKNPSRRN